jgi:3'-5' exoribonuclease
MAAIADLTEDRVVDGIYAVARKRRLRTRTGADYLAVELVDPSGRIEGRVWHDVDLLDGRFAEGDAVRVLGRVERFRNRLQLDVRAIEQAEGQDPAALSPTSRRDADELEGFLEFMAGEITHAGLKGVVGRVLGDQAVRRGLRALPASEAHHTYAGGLLEHTVGVATLCRERCNCIAASGDLLLAAALSRRRPVREHGRGRHFQPTPEGRLPGTSPRPAPRRGTPSLESDARAELLRDRVHRRPRRAHGQAAALYRKQLDAVAATRPVETPDWYGSFAAGCPSRA